MSEIEKMREELAEFKAEATELLRGYHERLVLLEELQASWRDSISGLNKISELHEGMLTRHRKALARLLGTDTLADPPATPTVN